MTGTARRLVAVSLVTAVSLVANAAGAQDKDAEAERLFREGQKLMEQKRLGEACPKFEAAYGKDKQLGTLLNLAYCHKQQGATWQAWTEFKEAESKASALKLNDRRDFARQRMAELEKQLARVVIDPPSKVDLTEVHVEDRRIWDAEKGLPIAVEAGPERKFTFLAKGKKPLVQSVAVKMQKRGEGPLHVTVGEMEDEPPPPPVVEATPVAKPEPVPYRAPPRDDHAGAWRTAMWVSFGVGVPVLAAGAILGVVTLGSSCTGGNRSKVSCPSSSDRASASTLAAVSTIGVTAGAIFTATGLGILLFAPKPHKTSAAWIAPDLAPGWAGVHGAF